jgi:large subunit ribosomal protein L7/L12
MWQAATGPGTPAEPITIPSPEGVPKMYSQKVEQLAAEISKLNLIEVSELSELLKKKLNLPDRPMMPMGGFMMPGGLAPAPANEDVAPTQVKMQFTVSNQWLTIFIMCNKCDVAS